MPETILLSPSASGKTTTALNLVLQARESSVPLSARVILPDSYQVVQFRAQLAAAGGALGVQVTTFGRVFHELLTLAGTPAPVAPEPVVERLLRTAVDELLARNELPHYARIAHTPGFLTAMRSSIAELKRALVLPDTFMKHVAGRSPGLTEIGRLYHAYQIRLARLGWADREGLNWLATESLEANPDLAAGWGALIVDGFDNFYPSQLSTLRLLGARLPELIITLPGELEHERPAHRRFQRTLAALRETFPEATIEGIPVSEALLPESLAHLERYLFEPDPISVDPRESLTRLELRSPREEAREALRWLKARVVRDGIKLDSCALVTPQPETYRPLLREAASEFGLPLRFTHGEPLTTAPAIDALLDLLDLTRRNWPRRLTIGALRSPYFDLSAHDLLLPDATALEDVSQNGQVIEGFNEWIEALERLALSKTDGRDTGEDLRLPHLPRGAEASRLLKSLWALADRLAPPKTATTTEWIGWLEDLLDDLHIFERAQSERDSASLVGLREALRALVLGEQVAGERPSDYAGFLAELRGALETGTYDVTPDFSQPAALVLRVLEARGLRFDAVAVLGLSEGQFPEVEREDPFLPENLRAELGLEPKLNREQGGLFYQAVTRANKALLLTRSYLAPDGERWEPSPFWEAAGRLFDGDPGRIQPEAPRPLAEAASPQELLFWGVRRKGLPKPVLKPYAERWAQLQIAREVLEAREGLIVPSRYEGRADDLAVELGERYGPNHTWSASRLECYGTCPFDFYIANSLGLQARQPPEPGLDAAQLGTLLHAILEEVYQAVPDPTDLASLLEALPDIAQRAFDEAPMTFGFRPTPLWAMEQAALKEALGETIQAIIEEEPGWTPVGYEAFFGIKDAPALELDLGAEHVKLRGLIDRVDRNEAGELRIIDYKTGSSHLTPADLYDGRRLQLPVYALGARDALGMGEPKEGLYWMILAAKHGSLRLSRFKVETEDGELEGPDAAYSVARGHIRKIVAGVRAGEFTPFSPRGGCPSYCPAVAWCWKYDPGWGG